MEFNTQEVCTHRCQPARLYRLEGVAFLSYQPWRMSSKPLASYQYCSLTDSYPSRIVLPTSHNPLHTMQALYLMQPFNRLSRYRIGSLTPSTPF